MAQTGVVQKKEFTKNGAPKFQVSGTWYFASRDLSPKEFPAGTSVEFESEEFGEDRGRGRPKAIKSWRTIQNGSGTSNTASTVTEVDLLRSVSNLVGNALTGGAIKTPEDLAKWCVAAKLGLEQGMKSKLAKVREPDPYADYTGLDESQDPHPEFDDSIGF